MLSESEINARQRRLVHHASERSELAALVDSLSPGVLILSPQGDVEIANDTARELLAILEGRGGARVDIARPQTMSLADGREISFDDLPHNTIVRDRRSVRDMEIQVDRPDGTRMWLCCSVSLLDEADPESSVVVTLADTTELHSLRERVHKSDNYDAVTGLPNLPFVLGQISDLLDDTHADDADVSTVVMVINFDKLKELNVSLGHLRGDRALAMTAERLRSALPARHLVGRVVGAEFVAVLTGLDEDGIEDISDLVHLLLTDPTDIDGNDLRMRASVGLVRLRPNDTRSAEDIISDADTAMYHAKMKGGGHTVDFDRLRLTGV
ncbi:diguanylate cyclase (GGDEF)-like protein [Williamsia limnetica]|jgi:diguanylate cyclase (GGDEF)-like protein|uniref:Diguanylate cyclase (GGDEF)-like protein n=1 Tax=Williamsia limnetica TaxID=882452 RepID=A0A318RV10_WILLI|nr:diguanylate cyclase [Williamsia limnetica]PYE20210.1 diguanylate cyclase (GGDEF)-like protein [Williamsia limnetica]